jgi:hypothetical protein
VFDKGLNKDVKRHYTIQLPREFDFNQYIAPFNPNTCEDKPDEPQVYRLYAVIVHHGLKKEVGHFVVMINLKMTDQYWLFNDETAEQLTDDTIGRGSIEYHTERAYLAFYVHERKIQKYFQPEKAKYVERPIPDFNPYQEQEVVEIQEEIEPEPEQQMMMIQPQPEPEPESDSGEDAFLDNVDIGSKINQYDAWSQWS